MRSLSDVGAKGSVAPTHAALEGPNQGEVSLGQVQLLSCQYKDLTRFKACSQHSGDLFDHLGFEASRVGEYHRCSADPLLIVMQEVVLLVAECRAVFVRCLAILDPGALLVRRGQFN